MRAALAVMRIQNGMRGNAESVSRMARCAARQGAELVLFPEASLTGLVNCDEPRRDLPLGIQVPGEVTQRLARVSRRAQIYCGIGVLERDAGRLYSSALLFSPRGDIVLRYRRISPGWHGQWADPETYGNGECIRTVDTPLGRVAFLLCGDLFAVPRSEVARLSVDWLLLPYARCSDDPDYCRGRWESEEQPHYVSRVAEMGVTTLMVNYLSDSSICRGMCGTCGGGAYGGAMVVSGGGNVLAAKPVGEPGLLVVDL